MVEAVDFPGGALSAPKPKWVKVEKKRPPTSEMHASGEKTMAWEDLRPLTIAKS
jgi:hypothetical protein